MQSRMLALAVTLALQNRQRRIRKLFVTENAARRLAEAGVSAALRTPLKVSAACRRTISICTKSMATIP